MAFAETVVYEWIYFYWLCRALGQKWLYLVIVEQIAMRDAKDLKSLFSRDEATSYSQAFMGDLLAESIYMFIQSRLSLFFLFQIRAYLWLTLVNG